MNFSYLSLQFIFCILFVISNVFFSTIRADLLFSEIAEGSPAREPITLDFDTAAKKTITQSFNLRMAENEIRAREGALEQTRLYSNPTVNYLLQTSELGWTARSDIYSLSQLIEWGIKRQRRTEVASSEYYASLASYDLTKLERLNRLSKSFIKSAAAQELFLLSMELQKITEETFQMVHSKLLAGKVSMLEHHKSELSKKFADLKIEQAAATLQNSKRNLRLILSHKNEDFDLVSFPIYETSPPPPLDDYLSTLCKQPEIIRSFYQHQAALANLRFEKVSVLPDLTVTLGYSYDAGDKGLVAGIEFPLPILNQNQGKIKKARAEMHKIADYQNQLWLMLETKLANAYVDMVRAFHEAKEIKDNLLKIADDAFNLSLEGYREGKFDYVAVLIAKQTLFETREKYIDSLITYHTNRTELEFITSLTD